MQRIEARKVQRFDEIKAQTKREIEAPFNYQLNLLEKEEDDITVALTEAIMDSNASYTDMLNRMDRLYEDKMAALDDEIEKINAALDRSLVDKKNPCKVLRSIRLDILKNVECLPDLTGIAYDTTDVTEFREYQGMFDDFHYDIGHGKGSGEGTTDSDPVVDGRNGRAPSRGPVGDYEVDVGATTRTWEGNLYRQ